MAVPKKRTSKSKKKKRKTTWLAKACSKLDAVATLYNLMERRNAQGLVNNTSQELITPLISEQIDQEEKKTFLRKGFMVTKTNLKKKK